MYADGSHYDELYVDYNVFIYYVNFKFDGDTIYIFWFKPALHLGTYKYLHMWPGLQKSTIWAQITLS